jgi:hypothetical protein
MRLVMLQFNTQIIAESIEFFVMLQPHLEQILVILPQNRKPLQTAETRNAKSKQQTQINIKHEIIHGIHIKPHQRKNNYPITPLPDYLGRGDVGKRKAPLAAQAAPDL